MKNLVLPVISCTALGLASATAAITGIVEVGLGGDTPAIVENGGFGEDALTFSDRTHQHNGAAFDAQDALSTTGANIIGLPSYLVGGDYIRFANNARDQAGYSATVTADVLTNWFLLIDNRVDGRPETTAARIRPMQFSAELCSG